MTDFWESELGPITGTADDAFAKNLNFVQIPEGTMALAKIESFGNQEYNGNKFLCINWLLTEGDFKGSSVEQKIKVYGDPLAKDPAKARHRALNMLKLIYQLFNVKPKHPGEPTDQDVAIFIGKEAGIKIRETEPNANGRQYNWVSEVHEKKGFKCETGVSMVVTHTNTQFGQGPIDSAFSRQSNLPVDHEDGIPF